ncbi:hypothetical protein [Microlunatus soli]|uniref:Uncharacterized protein n=1 Tax=Microlunatus soli TaxID=630515 RepID=A0A1H1Y0V7_9ACTN|nr:hypothetical protein [Microlunatus soli]SDT15061.1 hypothetical protein SAMN04489812_4339 [Microlunatus soli]
MIWVFVFGGIAVVGLIMVVSYAIWLAHKASDVYAEAKVLGARAEQFLEITSGIEVPEGALDSVKQTRLQPARRRRRRSTT